MEKQHILNSSRPTPLDGQSDFQLSREQVVRCSKHFNPTSARFHHLPHYHHTSGGGIQLSNIDPHLQNPRVQFQWRSRDNRKGRHTLVVPAGSASGLPQPTSSSRAVLRGILRMLTSFPWWDVSFLVAFCFSVGSVIFILSGFFYWLPLAIPNAEFPYKSTFAGGVASCIGGTVFEIGAIFLLFEAINENQTGCFGWELYHVLPKHSVTDTASLRYRPGTQSCDHPHCRRNRFGLMRGAPGPNASKRKWKWWPSWYELRTHYLHELGFLGSFTEILGATIFWINTILSLPGIYEELGQGSLWGVYWSTYLVGGVLFVVSSALYMLETQPTWRTPAPHLLGWWISLWNLIGSVGYTLAASLGYCNSKHCEYQSELTLIWASIAFMVGSLILWYEALHKHPVEVQGHES